MQSLLQELQKLLTNPYWYISAVVVGALVWAAYKAYLSFLGDRKMEEFRRDLLRRDKSAKIVDLFMLLEAVQKGTADTAKKEELKRTLWALCIYLDRDCICAMAETLVHGENLTELFVTVRRYIIAKDDGLKWDNIPVVK